MKRLILLFIVLIWFIGTIQLGWLWPAASTTLTVSGGFIVIAVLAFTANWQTALWYSLAQGFFIDLFSPFVFGTYASASVTLAILIGFLQDTWLKQRSLLSVATIVGVSLLVAQLVLFGIVALSEAADILITHVTGATTLLSFLAGWGLMVLLTVTAVRIFTRQYAKLI
jgi:hypothetical protein